MIYYTSDVHLYHKNIIRSCVRSFESIEEMNSAIIQNWNKRVNDKDTIYIF